MKRRNFVTGTFWGVVALSPLRSWAAMAPPIPPRVTGSLCTLNFNLDCSTLPAQAQCAIGNLIANVCNAFNRLFGWTETSVKPCGPLQSVQVNVSVQPHPAGHLVVNAHMPDGNGGHAFTHQGTAPSHTHPAMRSHIEQIVGKADTWLKARNA
jgi:hypothetical protein